MKTLLLLPAFLLGNFSLNASGLRISLSNENSACSTQLVFADGASSGFDKKSDKEMKANLGNNVNYIYSSTDKNQKLFLNYCPQPSQYFSVPIRIDVHQAGIFNLNLEDQSNDLSGISFSLTDVFTGETTPLTLGIGKEIILTNENLNSEKNYVLHIFPTPKYIAKPESCIGSKDGSIKVDFNEMGEWELKLRNGNELVAKNCCQTTESELENLASGIYFVQVWKNNMKICEEIVSVPHPAFPKSQFTITNDSVYAGKTLFTDNHSAGGNHWYWEFGDNTTSNAYEPAHVYQSPGIYKITLTTADGAGCTSVVSKKVFVADEKDGKGVISYSSF